MKWIWFSKDFRKLSDISTFDRASRGWFSGFDLIKTTRLRSAETLPNLVNSADICHRSFAPLGALLMLFAIAIDPLWQQLISSRPNRVLDPSSTATVGFVQEWLREGQAQQGWTVSGEYKLIILMHMRQPADMDMNDTQPLILKGRKITRNTMPLRQH